MTDQEFQGELDKCYALIEAVSTYSNIKRWKNEMLPFLKTKCTLAMKPWYWPTKSGFITYAITIRPYLIWLTDDFFGMLLQEQAATLVHEAVHIRQYFDGRLTWFDYIFNKSKRADLEQEAEADAILFRAKWTAYKKENP